MVNKALVLENRRGSMERKRKLVHQHLPGSSSRPCVATCIPSYSADVSAKATGSRARIFYPTVTSDTAPQQFPDSCYWKSECSEDSSCSEPLIG
jgi:hypothetical protein